MPPSMSSNITNSPWEEAEAGGELEAAKQEAEQSHQVRAQHAEYHLQAEYFLRQWLISEVHVR